MFHYLKNPSPAIRKRLALLRNEHDGSDLDRSLPGMRIIKKYFDIVDSMNHETFLFHGYDSLESCIKIFAEYGIDRKEKHYSKCLDLLMNDDDADVLYTRGLSRKARVFEDKGYSAAKAIRASLLICSGIEEGLEVQRQIRHSIDCFKAVKQYESIEDFACLKNGKWVYREGKLFPDYYNLRILALSSSWKNPETIRILADSVRQLAKMEPIPSVYVAVEGQLIAPGSYLMHDFDNDFSLASDNAKAEWLIRNEYMARLGIMKTQDVLRRVKSSLGEKDKLIDGMMKVKNGNAFKEWGAYSGVTLENDWRKPEKRINDLSFRVGLIEHYGS